MYLAPERIADLISSVQTSTWPNGELEQNNYFQRLGFLQSPETQSEASMPGIWGNLVHSELATTGGSWMAYKADLVATSLFLYQKQRAGDTLVPDGYSSIHSLLLSKQEHL